MGAMKKGYKLSGKNFKLVRHVFNFSRLGYLTETLAYLENETMSLQNLVGIDWAKINWEKRETQQEGEVLKSRISLPCSGSRFYMNYRGRGATCVTLAEII